MRCTGAPQSGHGWRKRPCTAMSGRKAVTPSGKSPPASRRRRSIQSVSVARVASNRRLTSSPVSARVSFTGDSRARCRISSPYALPMPEKIVGSVSARLSVWLSAVSAARNSSRPAVSGSSPPGSCSARAASPRTRWIAARFFVPASVMTSVPVVKSKAATPIRPGGRAPAAFQCSRPAIIRWTTTKRSASSASTIRLPISAERRKTSRPSSTPMPPTASPSTVMAKSVTGDCALARAIHAWASAVVYGWGSRERLRHTRRLFAWRTSESSSPTRHGRKMLRASFSSTGGHLLTAGGGRAPVRRYNRGLMRPAPPLAKRVPKTDVVHGERREDEYSWLRDKDSPEVTAYLEAENAYTDAAMKGSEAFQDALYKEMLARIKEDDSSVPYRRGAYVYYARTETGKQYPIHCRRRDVPGAPEEITLDLNRMAEGHAFLSLGVHTVSDDARLLAYSVDFTGFRDYTLHVKDLETGAVLADRIEKVSSAAWSADNSILFYVTEDEAKRPYRLWRHRLGAAADDLLLEETDALFRLGVFRSRSPKLVFAAARSFTSGEYRCR